jgi:hypothetical protein
MEIRIMCIAWPAFLAACVLELLVFAFFDPLDLQWAGQALAWSRQAVYTAAFFAFWLVCTGACALTALLRITPRELNALQRFTRR